MKTIILKGTWFLVTASLLIHQADAQRPGKTRPANRAERDTYNIPLIIDSLPYIIDSASVFSEPIANSLKPPSTFDHKANDIRTPLPLEHLRWDDALYAQKVWRELDLREKINQPFRYDAIEENGSTLFMNILLKAIQTGVPVFKDERFSIPLSPTQINEATSGKLDTSLRLNLTTQLPEAYIVTRSAFDTKSITKLLMMEEWIFDSKGSRMHCRIIGLAPLKTRILPGSKQTEASSIMFWVNYNDIRPALANAQVYNPRNMGRNRMTWEELFESRMFSSTVTRSTIDNVSNKPIRFLIKDPVLALLEGDNIKEKIFNYEQDLWSY